MKKCNKGLLSTKRLLKGVAILLSFIITLPVFAQNNVNGKVTGKDGAAVSGHHGGYHAVDCCDVFAV